MNKEGSALHALVTIMAIDPAIMVTKACRAEPSLAIEDAIQANKYCTTPTVTYFYEQYSTCLLGTPQHLTRYKYTNTEEHSILALNGT